MSPVLSQPVRREDGGRRFRILEVALEHGLRPDLDLAVVGDAHLEAGERPAHGPEAVQVRPVRAGGGRALGEAVALGDADPDGVEELDDLLRQRGASRSGHAESSAEGLPHLAEDELVRETLLPTESGRHGLAGALEPTHLAPDRERPVEQALLHPRGGVEAGDDGGVDLLVHARDAR